MIADIPAVRLSLCLAILRCWLTGEHPFEPLPPRFAVQLHRTWGLDLGPGERAMLEVILQNARGQGWADRAFLSFYGAHNFSAADDFRL